MINFEGFLSKINEANFVYKKAVLGQPFLLNLFSLIKNATLKT